MTTITHTVLHDTYIFDCSGHTGYSSAGRDILCSAVSILCYTLASYLEKAYNEGSLASFISDFGEGSVRMRYELSDTADMKSITEAVSAIISGFALLEESFHDYITLDI